MITKVVQRLSDFQSTYSRLCEQGEQGGAGVVRTKNPTKNIRGDAQIQNQKKSEISDLWGGGGPTG